MSQIEHWFEQLTKTRDFDAFVRQTKPFWYAAVGNVLRRYPYASMTIDDAVQDVLLNVWWSFVNNPKTDLKLVNVIIRRKSKKAWCRARGLTKDTWKGLTMVPLDTSVVEPTHELTPERRIDAKRQVEFAMATANEVERMLLASLVEEGSATDAAKRLCGDGTLGHDNVDAARCAVNHASRRATARLKERSINGFASTD
jgi:DNA-directed RNA polymerase specialized sigma24 family protein